MLTRVFATLALLHSSACGFQTGQCRGSRPSDSILSSIEGLNCGKGLLLHVDDDDNIIISGDEDTGDKTQQYDPTFSPSSAMMYVTLMTMCLAFPLVANAIDHPADHAILGIPIPVPDARYFVSGGVCAAASHGVATPIDVVKTRIQANPAEFDGMGLLGATQSILDKDGPSALLGGLGPTVVGYGLEGAVKFGLYESFKPIFASLLHLESDTVPFLAASIVAGAAASFMLLPLERTRVRIVTDPTFKADGLIDGLSQLVNEQGLQYVFTGMPAMLTKQVPYTMTKQVTFDIFAGMLYTLAAGYSLSSSDVKLEVEIAAAFLASILSCLMSHPGDVILTRTYKSDGDGVVAVASEIYNERGLQGFVTGLSARFLHVGSIITSQLVLYDIIKQMLGLPATGSH